MTTADVDIDVFSNSEILEELKSRINATWNTATQKLELRENIKNILNINVKNRRFYSLLDEMKIDMLMNNLDKIKLEDLEKLIV